MVTPDAFGIATLNRHVLLPYQEDLTGNLNQLQKIKYLQNPTDKAGANISSSCA